MLEKDKLLISIELQALAFEGHALKAEMEGMLSENKHREVTGFSLAYGEESFNNLRNKFISLSNETRNLVTKL